MQAKLNRRNFLKAAAGIGGLSILSVYGQSAAATKKPLRVAVLGCGIRGAGTLVPAACEERLVALVDADRRQIDKTLEKVHKENPAMEVASIRTFTDYRKLFDEMGKELDAVMIATPNHQHVLPALLAIRRGIHVYVEKPMAHTISEARQLAAEAKRYGVITQMGQHGHSSEGSRRLCEYIWAGAIGQVREVYCWSDRVNGLIAGRPPAQPVPAGLDWEQWLGPAPFRDFHDGLHPHDWHSWFDFGNGSIGNMGNHIIDHAYWALKLGAPTSVELEDVYGGNDECWPVGTRIRWDFPAREGMAPVKLYWYDGLAKGQPANRQTVNPGCVCASRSAQNLPPFLVELEKKYNRNFGSDGSLLVGDKGIMTIGPFGEGCRMVPEEAHRAFPRPAATLPRVKRSHQVDFFRACRGGARACANFDYSEPLAEIVLLGDIAIRAGVGRRVEWDGPAMRCTNLPELNRYLTTTYRDGWRI